MSSDRVRGGAPTDADLLCLFVDLVNEYDRLGAAFPVSASSAELLEFPTADIERWHRVVRALAIRKFILGAQDAVRVDRVITAFRRSLVADLGTTLDDLNHEFARLIVDINREGLEIFEDLLYGEFLHGEYERHQRNLARRELTKDLALWRIGEPAEFLIRRLRTAIIVAARNGHLDDNAQRTLTAWQATPDGPMCRAQDPKPLKGCLRVRFPPSG